MTTRIEKEKLIREEDIVSAAEKLFYERGFEQTSMDDIAAQAEFTKRTVYQYFSSKHDLYYAVVLRGMRRLLERVKDAGEDKKGFERLREKRLAAWRCARSHSNAFGVMSQINLIRHNGENSRYEKQIADLSAELFLLFRGALEQCWSDGSIPEPKEPLEPIAAFFIFVGTLARLTDVGDAYAAQFGIDTETFALSVLSLTDRLFMPWGNDTV
jgi:AcrR family transcriptional regulator